MPIYQYVDRNTEKTVEVVRSFRAYDTEPTEAEAKDSGLTSEEYSRAEWERLVGTNIAVTRGPNFTGSKGNW